MRVQNENPDFWRPFAGTLDEDFMPRALTSFDLIYCVHDSDEAAVISLTPRSFMLPYLPEGQRLDAQKVSCWAESCAAPLHKMLFEHYSIWHSEGVDLEDWAPTIGRSTRFASAVKSMLSMPDSVIQGEMTNSWLARSSRVRRLTVGPPVAPTPPPSEKAAKLVAHVRPIRIVAEIIVRLGISLPPHMRYGAMRVLPTAWVNKLLELRRTRDSSGNRVLTQEDMVLALLRLNELIVALIRSTIAPEQIWRR